MAERTRARTLIERMQEKTIQAETSEQQELLDEEQNLLSQFVTVNRRLQISSQLVDREIRQADERWREELEESLSRVEGRIRREIPAYAALQTPQTLTMEETRRLVVTPETLLLSFCFAGSIVAGWAVRHESVEDGTQMFEVGDSEEVNATSRIAVAPFNLPPLIAAYEEALSQMIDPQARQKIAEKLAPIRQELAEAMPRIEGAWAALAEALWEQVRPELKQGVTRLIVLPDGELNVVPFELLPVGESTLGASYSITYAPSATALKKLRDLWASRPALPENAPEFLGFGDPDFGTSAGGNGSRVGIARLPGTRDEVGHVALYFSHPITFYDADVTKANINLHLEEISVLLGATHGLLDSTDPLSSGLIMAGGDVWTARELIGRRRPLYLDLLVASACNSGRGTSRIGEGVVGFSAALMAVGVKCAILSLWPVDDNATCHFMTAFFQNWSHTRSVQTALKFARAYVQNHPKYEDDPYYWAGFIAVGMA